MKHKILITGGAGYLGSILVPHLLSLNYAVTVLDNFLFRQASLLDCCSHPDFAVIRGDCRDPELMRRLLAGHDSIIPLAALVGAPICQQDQFAASSTNRDAILMLLRLASRQQQILVPITNSGYGIGEHDKLCTEESPLRPLSLYGRLKVEAEEALLQRDNSVSLRLATVFGISPRMRLDLLVNDFVYRAINDSAIVIFEGKFKRNFIHVRDVARAFAHVLENFQEMKNNAYNVGLSEANLSKLELCKVIQRHLPKFVFLESEIGEDPDKRDYIVSNEKIERSGFQAKYSLDQGIQELIKGYQVIRNNQYGNV
ncbi:MAG: NAD(P)-dependent oxidoreductase [Lentisphaerae bacterium]|nr:NAD(P)-dependent oxidoreductase [Lentisphaerota bacterium]